MESLQEMVKPLLTRKDVGILLSGGMDSAILAALMPPATKAYTIRFIAEGAIDESPTARLYCQRYELDHRVIEVTWEDYLEHADTLMRNKKSTLHPVEVGLYKAATAAHQEGINTLVLGNGADSTFGGLDKLLSRDWSFEQFIERYTFVQPASALKEPVPVRKIYEPYGGGEFFDTTRFLKVVHGLGVIQAFDNAITSAGCRSAEPYERLVLDAPLDMDRIRGGDSKYLLRSLFDQLYPGLSIPEKIAFARPMDKWLKAWDGPLRSEFRSDIELSRFTGEQKWLLYCLNRFLGVLDRGVA
jgi:hypothetical protein